MTVPQPILNEISKLPMAYQTTQEFFKATQKKADKIWMERRQQAADELSLLGLETVKPYRATGPLLELTYLMMENIAISLWIEKMGKINLRGVLPEIIYHQEMAPYLAGELRASYADIQKLIQYALDLRQRLP